MVCRMVLLVCVSALLLSVAGEGVAGDVGGVGGEGPAAARRISPQQDKTLGESPTSRNAALNYGVPPVIVDSSTPHNHKHSSGLKTGYFPPSTRVMPRVSHIEAECRDDFMKLRVAFNDSFSGLIYSAGYTHDHDCMYINGTGQNTYEFYIQLNRCGTLGGSDHHKREVKNKTPTKNYMWNTVTIQYSPLIEEEWDEHFKVTCEYGYDFWKTVTFPFLEVETNTADPVVFTLTPPECFMEIRSGYGLTGNRITGPVHVGDPITLLIYMRSQWDGFDMLVNDCVAHNGANKKIQLIDHHGCPVDEKLIAKFQGTWAQRESMYETVIYAHMKTFRFTGTPALYIECDIRMCHGKCPTQPCNWRDTTAPAVRRRKRSVGNITAVQNPEEDDQDEEVFTTVDESEDVKKNTSFSESLSLFQSIQVLANEEDEKAFNNATASRVLVDEGDYCFSSLLFTSTVCLVTTILILSGLSISVLCARVRRDRKGGKESAADMVHTLRSVRSGRSEYIHSPQARIP